MAGRLRCKPRCWFATLLEEEKLVPQQATTALKIFLSAIIAGIIAWGGAFMAVVSGQTPMNKTQIVMTIVTGIVAFAKDIQAYLTKPPEA